MTIQWLLSICFFKWIIPLKIFEVKRRGFLGVQSICASEEYAERSGFIQNVLLYTIIFQAIQRGYLIGISGLLTWGTLRSPVSVFRDTWSIRITIKPFAGVREGVLRYTSFENGYEWIRIILVLHVSHYLRVQRWYSDNIIYSNHIWALLKCL